MRPRTELTSLERDVLVTNEHRATTTSVSRDLRNIIVATQSNQITVNATKYLTVLIRLDVCLLFKLESKFDLDITCLC